LLSSWDKNFLIRTPPLAKALVIREKEIGMSRRLLGHGWNIDCVLSKYQGRDYRRINTDINPTSVKGDPYYVGAYFGGTIDPKEAVFFKYARFIFELSSSSKLQICNIT
jgi:hypothetical protein